MMFMRTKLFKRIQAVLLDYAERGQMKKLSLLILILIIPWFLITLTLAQEKTKSGDIQQTCFIMKGNPINTRIYADYKGHRIYFCCRDCLRAFQQNPEAYFKAMMEAKFPLEKTPEKK